MLGCMYAYVLGPQLVVLSAYSVQALGLVLVVIMLSYALPAIESKTQHTIYILQLIDAKYKTQCKVCSL